MGKTTAPNLFDFGLSSDQEERARRLHRESIIIDMLHLGPVSAPAYTDDMVKQVVADYERHHNAERSLRFAEWLPARMAVRGEFPAFKEWWDASGITAVNRELAMDTLADAMQSLAFVNLQFDRFDWLIKALHADDIRRAKAEGKIAGFVNCQNTIAIGQDVDNIDMYYEAGLRVIQLTYNSMNFVASGCTERTDAGVSTFGAKCIDRMNRLGIVVDTSHCGRQTTLDACALSRSPVVATHSFAKALSGHARGKSDEELVALAKTGGVIGVVALPSFLSKQPGATVQHYMDHVDYITRLVGYEHVGVGTDWPMMGPEYSVRMLSDIVAPTIGFRPEDRIGVDTLVGLSEYRQFINITRGLVSRGYSDEQIRAILGGNWLRVMDQVWR